jgi:hypothetical protein
MKDNYKKLYESFDKSIYSISLDLIKNICNDLNETDKIEMFVEKYLLKPNTKPIKKIKDKNAPKRNKSSYMFFQEDIRPKLKAKFPDDTLGQLSKRLGKLWSDLKDRDKKKYDKLAEKDKLRYEKELNIYKTGGKIEKSELDDNYSESEDNDSEDENNMNSSISQDDSYIIHGNSSNSGSASDSYSDEDDS